jgi:hypothetical protein
MIYVKINDTLLPATIAGKVTDEEWDGRSSKSITLEMSYNEASTLFVDGLEWKIAIIDEIPLFDDHGEIIDVDIKEAEFDNSEYNIAGDITDHRDGTITVKMGKLTELEEAYEIMLGGI